MFIKDNYFNSYIRSLKHPIGTLQPSVRVSESELQCAAYLVSGVVEKCLLRTITLIAIA